MTYVLQRTVFPSPEDREVHCLYLSGSEAAGAIRGRTSLQISPTSTVSLASYFNAFPASYWAQWTALEAVELSVSVAGTGSVNVWISDQFGHATLRDSQSFSSECSVTFNLPLTRDADGGWLWFDITAGDDGAELRSAEWLTHQHPARLGNASIGITTFNKPGFCVDTLSALAEDASVHDVIDVVYIVDQGTDRVVDAPGFAAIDAHFLDASVRILTQANLGGSGGFSRAMLETLNAGQSAFVQLLDDDVQIEPEAIRRSVMFGRYCSEPTIVGAHMFDLLNRTKLHAWAEVVDDAPFMWRRQSSELMPIDFSATPFTEIPIVHQRMHADYNGWWMCLIPVEIIREVGLSLPAFIKWDDAEFALRARDAGFATVTVPGLALWHIAWTGKDDMLDWQAYFHARNRILAALLHSRSDRGGELPTSSRRVDLKHLMAHQYYPVELRYRALKDVLSGPDHVWPSLSSAMPVARAIAAEFPETTVRTGADLTLPDATKRAEHTKLERVLQLEMPSGWRLALVTATTLIKFWLRPTPPAAPDQPDVAFSAQNAKWWRISQFDSVAVTTADGSGKNVYVHNRVTYRRMLARSIRTHRELKRRWPELSEQYRHALTDLTSPENWKRALDQ